MEHLDILNHGEVTQVRTKNEIMLIEFDDEDKRQIFELIAKRYADNNNKIKLFNNKFLKSLEKKYSKEKVLTVLEELRDFNILPQPLYRYFESKNTTIEENGQHNNSKPEERYALSNVNLLIIGSDFGIKLLKQKAQELSFKKVVSKSFVKWNKQDVEKAINETDFMIVETSMWNPKYLNWINKVALSNNLPWLLVDSLNLSQIKVGPIFQGKETACYNCLTKRLQGNKAEELLEYDAKYEAYLSENNLLSKPDQSLFNPSQLFDIAASMALIEVTKFFKYWSVPALWGHYISLDVHTFEMTRHKVLKVPTCQACKPQLEYNSSPWLESIALNHE